MVINVREESSIFANKGSLVCVKINVSIAKGIWIMLRTVDIKFILVGRIYVFFIQAFFEIFRVNSSLYFS